MANKTFKSFNALYAELAKNDPAIRAELQKEKDAEILREATVEKVIKDINWEASVAVRREACAKNANFNTMYNAIQDVLEEAFEAYAQEDVAFAEDDDKFAFIADNDIIIYITETNKGFKIELNDGETIKTVFSNQVERATSSLVNSFLK